LYLAFHSMNIRRLSCSYVSASGGNTSSIGSDTSSAAAAARATAQPRPILFLSPPTTTVGR
jgi:hypothetical protein